MSNAIGAATYTAIAKQELAAEADAKAAHYGALAAIEDAYVGTNSDTYAHHSGMSTAHAALAADLRS